MLFIYIIIIYFRYFYYVRIYFCSYQLLANSRAGSQHCLSASVVLAFLEAHYTYLGHTGKGGCSEYYLSSLNGFLDLVSKDEMHVVP